MQIDGLHQVGYLLAIAYAVYVAFLLLVWSGSIESDKFGVSTKRSRHFWIVGILGILFVFQPFKLVTQSDESRTAMRHSFDTPVYQSDREKVETSNPSYDLGQIREEQVRSKEKWDSIRNQDQENN